MRANWSAWIRDALLAAFGTIGMWQLTRLVSSVDELNQKMATVVTTQDYLNKITTDHEHRLRNLEKGN